MSLEELSVAVEEALDSFKSAEALLDMRMSFEEELREAVEHLKRAGLIARRLLRGEREERRRSLEEIARFSRLAQRRIERILEGRGSEEDWWEADAFIGAMWVDVLFLTGKLRPNEPVAEGAEDLSIPSPAEPVEPEFLREAREEMEAEFSE